MKSGPLSGIPDLIFQRRPEASKQMPIIFVNRNISISNKFDGNVAAFIFVINLFDLNGSDNLVKKGYKVENLIEFPGH